MEPQLQAWTEELEKDADPRWLIMTRRLFDQIFTIMQVVGLIWIAIIAVACFVAECLRIGSVWSVTLGDLLMLFLYIEVVVMARGAMVERHAVTIEMPVCIAVVAMARYMVVSPSHDPVSQIIYAGSIALLVLALIVWRLRTNWERNRPTAKPKA